MHTIQYTPAQTYGLVQTFGRCVSGKEEELLKKIIEVRARAPGACLGVVQYMNPVVHSFLQKCIAFGPCVKLKPVRTGAPSDFNTLPSAFVVSFVKSDRQMIAEVNDAIFIVSKTN